MVGSSDGSLGLPVRERTARPFVDGPTPRNGLDRASQLSLDHRPQALDSVDYLKLLLGECAYRLKLPSSFLIHPVFPVSLLMPKGEDQLGLRMTGSLRQPLRKDEFKCRNLGA